MKPVEFLGDSLTRLQGLPALARSDLGFQLGLVQQGIEPTDWKPMTTVGPGVREIRVRDEDGAFRLIYLAAVADRVLVLHVFQKKTQRTPQAAIDLAARRLRDWQAEQRKRGKGMP